MVDVHPVPAEPLERAEVRHRQPGAFEVVGPVAVAGGDLGVQRADLRLLRGRQRVAVHDEEVAVTVQVRFADGERALEVRPDEPSPRNARAWATGSSSSPSSSG
jgi:hypothetical protein